MLQEANSFHPLPGETSEDAKRRHAAFEYCWEETRRRIEVLSETFMYCVCVCIVQC